MLVPSFSLSSVWSEAVEASDLSFRCLSSSNESIKKLFLGFSDAAAAASSRAEDVGDATIAMYF